MRSRTSIEKKNSWRALVSEAIILIDSLEASSRTGMMGMGWSQRQVQMLMEQTAQLSDVLYAATVNAAKQVIADSRSDRVGSILPFVPPQPGWILQRYINDGEKSIEVPRSYRPWYRQKNRGQGYMSCMLAPGTSANDNLFAMVGLDPSPFAGALRQDMQQTYVLFSRCFCLVQQKSYPLSGCRTIVRLPVPYRKWNESPLPWLVSCRRDFWSQTKKAVFKGLFNDLLSESR